MWSHIEGMALFVSDDLTEWHMLHDSEGNAKRTMLIGTAVLETLMALVLEGILSRSSSPSGIRNIGLIVTHLLTFAHSMTPRCRLNENGWMSKVLKMADEYDIDIDGQPGTEDIIAEIRETVQGNESAEEQNETWWMSGRGRASYSSDYLLCYKGRPREGGVLTLANRNADCAMREWSNWTWMLEFHAYKQFQSVKVGPGCAPVYGGNIGGKFYDLTAQRNKRSHMRPYRLGKGA